MEWLLARGADLRGMRALRTRSSGGRTRGPHRTSTGRASPGSVTEASETRVCGVSHITAQCEETFRFRKRDLVGSLRSSLRVCRHFGGAAHALAAARLSAAARASHAAMSKHALEWGSMPSSVVVGGRGPGCSPSHVRHAASSSTRRCAAAASACPVRRAASCAWRNAGRAGQAAPRTAQAASSAST